MITPLPPVPQRNDPSTFADKGDVFLASLPLLAEELNIFEAAIVDTVVVATSQATSASTSAASAASSAILASGYVAAVGATIWVSGTSYVKGDARYSPTNLLTYRRLVPGGGTTDPAFDSVNWLPITPTSAASSIFLASNFGGF